MASRHCFWANLLVLGAFVAVARAAICFEGTPRRTFRDDRFHITGSEADGRVCGIVVREPADVGSSDFESFSYSWSNLGAPIFGDAAAIGGVDFEAPSTRTASFNGSSLSVEICVDVLMDNVACEQSEDFSVQLASTSPAFNPICSDDRAVATIADSTAINIGFATSMNEVFENQGSIELEVVRAMGTQNLNVAQVTITEDPDTPGCLAGGSDIKYTCVAARCTDGNLFNLSAPIPRITILPLAPDDTVVDGHRECRILLQPFQGSTCVYNITTGSTQVRIIDNERLLMNFQPDFYEADEDSGGVDVTVQLTGSPSTTEDICFTILQSVNPATTPATIGVDLPNRTYSSSVLAGQTSATVRILFTPDQVFEETEVLMLNLVPCQNRFSFFPPARDATVQIKNDDGITVRFPESLTVNESDGEISFSLLIEEEYEGELCIFTLETREIVEELNGVIQAAKPGEDFTPVDATEICFRNNQSMSDPFRVLILNSSSNVPECNEVFSVKLETTSEFNLLMVTQDVSATVTIIDTSDPYLVQFSQNEYKVVEDLGGLDITVTVDRPPAFDILFTAVASVRGSGPENANIGGGLGIGIDVLNNMWNGTISAGSRSITIPIDVLPDNLTELDEEFYLDLSVSSKCQLVQANAEGSTALVVIEDDDSVEITVVFDSTVVEGEASVANITFTVVGQFNIPFAINVNFMDGSATDPTDYNGTSQTIVFNEDNRSLVVSVPIVNDGDTEENENFQFFAETDSSVRISVMTRNSMGSIVIEDNEVTHFFELTSYVVPEDSGSLRVSVRRRGDLSRSSAVHIAPANHSSETPASSSQDFPTSTVVASFSAGEELKEFEVPITSDMRSELNETFLLQLVEIPALLVEDLVVEPSQATVTITDFNDVVCVSLSASSYSATEGDGSAEFVVEADKSFSYEFSVVVTVMPVTATAGDDYTESSFELTFMPGQQSLTRSLSIIDDPVKEEQESVNLVLSVPDGNPRPVCINTPGTAALTIADNDDLSVQFDLEEYSVSEGGTITVNVVANAEFSKSFIVDISHDGAGDLSLSNPTLSFSPSSRTASVELTATTDSIKEPEESFTLTLAITDSMTQQFGVQLGTRSTAAVKVQDNSTSPECGFSPLNYTASEGSSVTLMLTCSELASVDYTLAVGHIGGDEDLTLSSTTVTIGAGSTQGSVELTATTDNIKECEESFQLTASLTASSTALGVSIGEGTATVAIADMTEDVAVNFDPASYTVSEGSFVEVFLTADKDYTEAFTVTVSSVNTEDITIQPSTVTFQPPSKRVSVMVEAVTDAIQEPTESVALTFTIGDSCLESVVAGDQDQATVSITDTSDAVVVCFDESMYSVTEGEQVTLGLSANRDFGSSFSVTVTHADSDGDFTLEGIPVTFTPGGRTGSFQFASTADAVKELDETVSLMLQVDNDGGIDVEICSQSTSMVTIIDSNDLEVSFSPVAYNVMEGGSVTVTLQADTMAQVDYSIDVALDNAAAADLTLDSSTVEFSAGSTQATVVATGTADNIKECEESFQLTASLTDSSTALGVTIGVGTATAAISDMTGDLAITFAQSSYPVSEGGSVQVCLLVDKDYSEAFQVSVIADSVEDITLMPMMVTFEPFRSEPCVNVTALTDDIQEADEIVTLSCEVQPSCLQFSDEPHQATVTITDTSESVEVCFVDSSYSVIEGGEIIIALSANRDFSTPFSVTATHADPDGDYSLEGIPVTFTPGDRTGSFRFVSTADNVKEMNETVALTLQVDNAGDIDVQTCADNIARVTIHDISILFVEFEQPMYNVSEGGDVVVTVVASNEFTSSFTVAVSHNGPMDLTLSSNELNFAPGSLTSTVTVSAQTDDIKEKLEVFVLTLAVTDVMAQEFNVELGDQSTSAVNVEDTTAGLVISFSPVEYPLVEGGTAVVRLQADRQSGFDYCVEVSQDSGGTDFELVNSTAVFQAGSTEATVLLSGFADSIEECEETYQLSAAICPTSADCASIGTGTASVMVQDLTEDLAITFAQSSYPVSEGDSVQVCLLVDKDYSEAFGATITADSSEDLSIQPTMVTFQPPNRMVCFDVTVFNDTIQETLENVILSCSIDTTCLQFADESHQATVVITDNSDSVQVGFASPMASVLEGETVTIGLVADRNFTTPFTVDIVAEDSNDYTLLDSSVQFVPGSTEGFFRLSAQRDNLKETNESVLLELVVSNSEGIDVVVGPQGTTSVLIVDIDNLEVSFSPVAYNVMEGGSVTVTLQADTMAPVDYSIDVTLDNAAAADLTLDSSTVEFSAGSTQATVVASGTADNIKECEESFQLTASLTDSSTALGVTVGVGTATVVVADTTEDVAVNFNPASYNVSEGSSVEVFLTADKDYTEAFTVTVSSVNTEDITIQPSTVTFQPPSKRVSVMVEALTDAIQEPTESVALTFTIGDSCLESVVAGDQDQATVSITDTSDSVVVCFDESTYSVTEGAEVTIGLSADKDFTSSFSVTVTHADPDGDFTLEGIPVTFTPGGTSGSFRFVSTADNVKELDETVSLMLQVDNNGGIDVEICSQSSSVVTIRDDDDLEVSFSPVAYDVMEGGSVTVTLQADTMAQVDYSIDVTLDSAAAADLTLDSSTVEFSAGSTQATVVATGTADNIKECEESFQLTASLTDSSTALGVTIGDGTATVAIADTTEDVAVNFDPASYNVSEGSSVEVFLTADKDYTEAFTVTVSSVNTEDITIQPSTVTFQPPSKRVSVMVEALTDAIQEPTESVALTFTIGDSCLESVVAGDQDQATVSITDTSDSVVVCFDESTYSVTEGAEVTIGLSADKDFTSSFSVTVTHADPDGDFTLEGIPVTFTPGGTSGSFRFVSTADNVKELDETVSLMLQVDNNGGIDVEICSQSSSVVTIRDDDDLEVSFSPVAYDVMEGGSVTVTLQADTMAQVDYSIDVTLDSAAAADLTLDSSTVEFSAGSTQATVVATGTADSIKECEESFQLTASLTDSSTALGVTIGDGTATVAIADTTEDVAVNFDPASYNVSEGSSVEVFLTADKDYTEAFTVTVSSVNTEDITIQPSTVTFQPPNKRVSVMVEALTDAIQEPTESVALTFTIGDSCLESVVVGDQDEATVSITDTSDSVVVCFDESTYSVTEGAEVTIGLSADKDFTSSFSVTVTHADPDGDFTLEGIPVTFTPGGTSGSFRFVSTADNVKELNETVSLMLQVDNDGGIDVEICSQSTSMVTIVDDDDLEVSFSPVAYNVMEGGSVTVTLQADTMAQVNYSIDVTLDNAAAADLTLDSSTVEFSAGSTQATVVATGTADNIKECEESFQLTASLTASSTALGVTIGDGTATVAIADTTEDVAVNFDPASYTVSEGSSVEVFLTADKDYTEAFTVTVSSINTEDITIQPSTVTFQPPNKRVSVMVEAVTDAIQEPTESVALTFTIGDSCLESVVAGDQDQATVSITDSSDAVVVCFDESTYSVTEGAEVTIGLSADKDFTSSFSVTVTHAAPDGDFTLEGIPVTFTPGGTSGSFKFVATADNVKELNETVSLMLQVDNDGGIDVEICSQSTSMVTIVDDDDLTVTLSSNQFSVTEGNPATILVTASSEASQPYTVNVVPSAGTATEEDFTSGTYEATFSPGETVALVSIATADGDCAEPLESFTVALQSTSSSEELAVAIGSPSQAEISINDPTVVEVNFKENSYSSVEGEDIIATVLTDRCFEGELEVSLLPTLSGSADSGDFVLPPNMDLSNETVTEVTVETIDDTIPESTEQFRVVLLVSSASDGLNVRTGVNNNATFTIMDNDAVECQFNLTQQTVSEGDEVLAEIQCSSPATVPYTLTVVSTHRSTQDADFQQGPYIATLATGESSTTVRIRTISDACAEPLESFTLSLNLPSSPPPFSLRIGDQSTLDATVADNTVVPVHFEMSSYEVEEGETFSPAIVVARCYSGSFSVNVLSTDGTATGGSDYDSVDSTEVFSGVQRTSISIPTTDDDDDTSETFTVTLSADSVPQGLNVQVNPPSAPFTILPRDEPTVTVSFAQQEYRTKEGDMLVVRFTVLGPTTTPAAVRVISVNGTAQSGMDFDAVDTVLNPRVDTLTVHLRVDDEKEGEESFNLVLTIPSSASNVIPGDVTTATIFVRDLDTRTVNDTVIADPVYAVPLKIVAGKIPGLSGDLSICYEIHGKADTWFNFVSDTCLSVNAHYTPADLGEGRIGHVVDQLACLVVGNTTECKQVLVSKTGKDCSFTVDGVSLKSFEQDGVIVSQRRNRVRISAPNCDNQMVNIWASCEEFNSLDMMKIVVNRGFDLTPTSHGFLGQFWNIDASVEKFNDTVASQILNRESVNPHYVLHLNPPSPSKKRSLVGELFSQQWDFSRRPCLYVGSNQGGTGVAGLEPLGSVVEGSFTDYITSGPFEHTNKFKRFDTSRCQTGS